MIVAKLNRATRELTNVRCGFLEGPDDVVLETMPREPAGTVLLYDEATRRAVAQPSQNGKSP